jgi:sucrose-phosphate synthase
MHIAFLNPQGNFDPADRYWTEHPDFGGQLVYVKQVALAMADLGQRVDILTRQIVDPAWPEFAAPFDAYPGAPNVRIVRLPAGPPEFLRKELLWPHLVRDWVPNILNHYHAEGALPDAFTSHYGDGGLSAVLLSAETGVPFTFTAHSLGAQKLDKMHPTPENLPALSEQYHFAERLFAERLSMNRSAVNITSTVQERMEQYAHPAYRGSVDVHDDRRFAVIPPGVNLAIFGADARAENKAATQAHVRAMLARDIAKGRRELPAIIASSRLDPKKNHLGLLQAFAQSPELQAKANLVFFTGALDDPLRDDGTAGDSERKVLADLRAVVEQANLWGKVSAFAVGGQAALAAAYRFLAQRGSVFALAALYEPFGLAPLEAAAAGLALVVTQNGGPSESLRDEQTEYAVLVDPADPADIARGLSRVLASPEIVAEFARRGRQRVLDRYTWERTAQGYLAQIERVLRDPLHGCTGADELPLHPYFRTGRIEDAISLAELTTLYFQT